MMNVVKFIVGGQKQNRLVAEVKYVHNNTLPKVAVQCFVGQFCGYTNISASLKVCAENRQLRQAAKRQSV